MVFKWRREAIEQFILLLEQYECIYNVKSAEYLDRTRKAQAFNDILVEMKYIDSAITLEDLKKKLKNLRTQYAAELRQIDYRAKKSGAGKSDLYVPRLWCFDLLKFLRAHTQTKISKDNESVCSTDINDFNFDPLPRRYEYISVKPEMPEMPQKRRSTAPEKSPTSHAPKSHTQKSHTQKSATENMLAYAARHMNREEDEYLLMAKTYAMKLKKMEPLQRLYADKIINEVLLEGQIGALDRYTSIINPDAQEPIDTPSEMKDSME